MQNDFFNKDLEFFKNGYSKEELKTMIEILKESDLKGELNDKEYQELKHFSLIYQNLFKENI